jgi:DNA gyrase/topoisomerase IV subunit B
MRRKSSFRRGPTEVRSRPRSGQASVLRIEINNLEDAEGYFSILMTGAVEPRRNFIYINALAAKVDA